MREDYWGLLLRATGIPLDRKEWLGCPGRLKMLKLTSYARITTDALFSRVVLVQCNICSIYFVARIGQCTSTN